MSKSSEAILPFGDFINMPVPPNKAYMEPLVVEQSITLISGPRGIGKTWLGLSVQYSITTGKPLGSWQVQNPAKCLYVEAETPIASLQDRLKRLCKDAPPDNLFHIYPAAYAHTLGIKTNLLNQKWRTGFADYLVEKDFEVVFLDNLASLTPGIDENIKKDWDSINQWLLNLRFSGISVVMFHHTGKGGDQRGTSAREDNIDNSILLSRVADHNPADGAKFRVEFTKCRNVCGPNLESMIMYLTEDENGVLCWAHGAVRGELRRAILRLFGEGLNQVDIAEQLGVHRSTVSRNRQQLIGDNLLTKKGEPTQSGLNWLAGG